MLFLDEFLLEEISNYKVRQRSARFSFSLGENGCQKSSELHGFMIRHVDVETSCCT